MGWPVYIENKPDLVKFVAVIVDVFYVVGQQIV